MKIPRLVIFAVLLPVLVFGEEVAKKDPPKKETINSFRLIPKEGREAALKSALAAHAQKYHTGNWKWRVSQLLSGPDEGAYLVVEGPNSWTDLESRGDLGAEHQRDYDAHVLSEVARRTPQIYATLEPDASSVAADSFSITKTLLRTYYVKPGRGPRLVDSLKLMRKIWDKRGQHVVVWGTFFSGEPAYILAIRLKNGWKDLDDDPVDIRRVGDQVLGPGAYDRIVDEISLDTARVVDEMIEFESDLSSK